MFPFRSLFNVLVFAVLCAPAFAQQTLDVSDKRVAVLSDQQGVVSRKSPTDRRWSIVGGDTTPVTPGDQIRTGMRGPNAVRVTLKSGGTLVLGPGTTVEFPKPAS